MYGYAFVFPVCEEKLGDYIYIQDETELDFGFDYFDREMTLNGELITILPFLSVVCPYLVCKTKS